MKLPHRNGPQSSGRLRVEGGRLESEEALYEVERTFRTIKTVDPKVRPVYHYRSERVRAHVLLCMLARLA